jgi:hypothetical protein
MDFCLVINTCKGYYGNIDGLLDQLKTCKFHVLIVSGQEDDDAIVYENGIKIIKVKYTGTHLTSAIYINENIHEYSNINYWLFLPDTIIFGDNFFTNITMYYEKYLKNNEVYCLPFINPILRPTMDMGILHTKHIINMGNYLNKIKMEPPYSKEKLVNLKKQLIFDENTMLGMRANSHIISTKFEYKYENKPPSIFITNRPDEIKEEIVVVDELRLNKVYFVNLDLYKFQQNFNGPFTELIVSL